jgi:hypothetical protein
VEGISSVTPDQMVARLRRSRTEIEPSAPELAERVEERLAVLEGAVGRLPPEPMVPTHGAFRHDQLLPGGPRLGVLDLDTLRLRGASSDAGNFLAYLDAMAIRRPRLEPVLHDCRKTFTNAFSSAAPSDARWVSWYRSASLVKLATRSFFSLAPGWPERSETLLLAADDRLAVRDP